MRTENSIKNTVAAMITNLISVVIGFLAQRVFLHTLGLEYAGINGLFNNIISMLAIAELGVGTAIVYQLYKPIAEKDIPRIQSLMQFYKISYRVIAGVVLVLGFAVMPFLKGIVGEVSIPENLYAIFALFLLDAVASYMLTYKRSILYANEKNYVVNVVHIGYLLGMNGLQIAFLYMCPNIFVFLLIKVLSRLIENIVITGIANRKYAYLREKEITPLDKPTKQHIFTQVKGMLFHKVGGFLVLGSDNIIISLLFGIKTVGLYTNYNMIIQAIENFAAQIFTSITASIGNLLVEKDSAKSYQVYKKLLFFNFVLILFCTVAFQQLAAPFITLVYGAEYVLPSVVTITIAIKFYFQNMRKTTSSFKEAAGVFYEDRFMPILEVVVNVVASVILGKMIGLAGVFIGTALSSLVLYVYSYPKFVYKPIFQQKIWQYWKENGMYLGIMMAIFALTNLVTHWIPVSSVIGSFAVGIGASIIVPFVCIFLIFHKTEEWKYFIGILQQYLPFGKK